MKVSIVGAGRVGASAAFSIMQEYMPDELVLVDVVPKLAEGQALDLTHAATILDLPVKVTGSKSINAIKKSDIVVVTAGKARDPNMTRMQLLEFNAKIIKDIADKVKKLAPKSVLIMVTNPVDPLTYLAWKVTGFPRKRVFGVGNLLDSARLVSEGYPGLVIGQHGEYFVPLVPPGKFAQAIRAVKKANVSILKWKGGTEFGPAIEISEAVGAVMEDLDLVMPVSCILKGEYELEDLALGVPARVGKGGIKEIIEVELDKKQKPRFMKAALAVDMALDQLGLKS